MRIALFGGSFDPPHCGHLAIARAAQQALSLDRILFAPVALQPLKPAGPSASFEDRAAMTALAIAGQPNFELSLVDAPHIDHPSPNHTPNYTIDSLANLRATVSPRNAQWFLLLGADAFRSLRHWHRAAEIPFAATLIVASRPGQGMGHDRNDLSEIAASLPPPITAARVAARADAGHPHEAELVHYRIQRPPNPQASPQSNQADLYLLTGLHNDVSATQLREQIQSHSSSLLPAQPGPLPALPDPLPAAVLDYIAQHRLYRDRPSDPPR